MCVCVCVCVSVCVSHVAVLSSSGRVYAQGCSARHSQCAGARFTLLLVVCSGSRSTQTRRVPCLFVLRWIQVTQHTMYNLSVPNHASETGAQVGVCGAGFTPDAGCVGRGSHQTRGVWGGVHTRRVLGCSILVQVRQSASCVLPRTSGRCVALSPRLTANRTGVNQPGL